MSCPRFLPLAGPTAVGKSEIALLLAEQLNGEIISVDSMQVYRGLDIGTAKPSVEERARVPHHLIDILELHESFDAARFVRLASAAIPAIQARGRLPILCGGTGLYFKVLLEGVGFSPPPDPSLRAELEALPLPDLLKELAAMDPATYERIDRQNSRRVIRALEVIRLTGKPFSEQRAHWVQPSSPQSLNPWICALKRPSGELQRRINCRVEEMFRRGLLTETEELLKRGLRESPTARQALGYKQVLEHLEGARSFTDTVELVKIRTRQYAKRQLTWLRGQHRVSWVNLESGESSSLVARQIAEAWANGRWASGGSETGGSPAVG